MGQRDLTLAAGRTPTELTRAWRLAYGLAGALFLLAGFHFGATAAISPELAAEWALQPAQLGLLGSLLFYAYAAVQIPAGMLADTLGSRRMLILSALLTGLGAGVFGTAPSFAVALAGRVLLGIGTGMVFTAGVRQISTVTASEPAASERFIAFFGPFTGLNYLGVALASVPLVWVVGAVGWRPPLLAAAVLSSALAVALWLLPGTPEPAVPGSGTRLLAALAAWRGERTIWGYTLMRFLYGSFVGMQTLWVAPLLLVTFGFAREVAGWVLLAMALGQASGPALASWITTRLRRPLVVITSAACTYAAICLALLALTWVRPASAFVITVFFALAVMHGATLIGYGLVTTHAAPDLQGTIAGLVNVGPWLGSAVFQLAVGYLVQGLLARPGSPLRGAAYAAALLPLAVVALVATPLTRLLKERSY